MDSDSIGDRLKEIKISKSDDMENVLEPVEDEVSDSIRECLKEVQMSKSDCIANANESMEEDAPKILSPEIQDVFHIFASMLDIVSLVKFAMTSKEMYKRVMEDNQIKISVHLDSLDVISQSSAKLVQFSFANVPRRIQDYYVAAAQKFPCKITLDTLYVRDISYRPEYYVERYLNETVMRKMQELWPYRSVVYWNEVFAIIKDFSVRSVDIHCTINDDILRSILQLNLEKLTYRGRVLVDFILEIDSPIQEIYFPDVRQISKEKLLNIMAKIQSGSLKRLTVDSAAVDWRNYDKTPFDYQGQLPDDRPLLLEKNPNGQIREFWFLHWHGGVTKCEVDNELTISKCELWECPWILRKDEDVLKDLAEKHPMISCSADHFRSFYTGLTMIDPSYKGMLPENRPLYFQVCENHFWLLKKDDKLMKCTWKEGCVKWEAFGLNIGKTIDHPALAKYIFWKVLKQVDDRHKYSLYCKESIEFLNDFKTLDFDYSGPLPNKRPLIFETSPESTYSESRVVLLEDRLLECIFMCDSVNIQPCHIEKRPPILFTAKNVVWMLKYVYKDDVKLNVPFEMFRDGLELFKKSILVLQKRLLISEKTKTEFWYSMKGFLKKATWDKGLLSISDANDIHESPPNFMEQAFRMFAEAKVSGHSLKLDLEQIDACLKQFTVVPIDYSGSLTTDSPMAFVEKEVCHISCLGGTKCQCSVVRRLAICFLWYGRRLTKCSWKNGDSKEVQFGPLVDIKVPPALKSKEYFMLLLQGKYLKSSKFRWFGDLNDFNTYLEEYMKLSFHHRGPLPKERPLCFDNRKFLSNVFILREDGTVVVCEVSTCCANQCSSCVCLSVPSTKFGVPPALHSML